MALTKEQEQEVREEFLKWSGGYPPHEFCSDDGDYGPEAFAEHHSFDGMDDEDVEAFVERWKEEGEEEDSRAFEERQADPIVWSGELRGRAVRVRRTGEASFAAEADHGPRGWVAASPADAAQIVALAYAAELHDRGLPREAT